MCIKKLLTILAILPLFAYGETLGEQEEIRVHLATQSPLSRIYIGKLQSPGGIQGTPLDAAYLAQIEKVLENDLNYNGSSQISPRSSEKEHLLQASAPSSALNPQTWKNLGIPYVVKWTAAGKTISASVLSSQSGSVKHFNEIPLTGDLNQDRRQIHKLADGITKALFNCEGIANTRILYSYQVKSPKADGSEWASEIWECDWDGANARQITREGSYCVTPVLLPHSSQYANDRFLYVSYKIGQPKIYIASLKEGVGKRLIDLKGNQLLPPFPATEIKSLSSPMLEGGQISFYNRSTPKQEKWESRSNSRCRSRAGPIACRAPPQAARRAPCHRSC